MQTAIQHRLPVQQLMRQLSAQKLLPLFFMFFTTNHLINLVRRFIWFLINRRIFSVEITDKSQPDLYRWIHQQLNRVNKITTFNARLDPFSPLSTTRIYYEPVVTPGFIWIQGHPVYCTFGQTLETPSSFSRDNPIQRTVKLTAASYSRSKLEHWMQTLPRPEQSLSIWKALGMSGGYSPTSTPNPTDPDSYGTNVRSRWYVDAVLKTAPKPILPDGQLEHLMADVRRFLGNKDFYQQRDIPYRRGYLFYGLPGTGKTTLVRYLAHHFNLDVILVSELRPSSLEFFPRNAIVVFEDLDRMVKKAPLSGRAAFYMDDGNSNDPTSTLIQVLDGVHIDNGRIYIATCNNHELLDPALLRAGRFDYKLQFSSLHPLQLNALVGKFYPNMSADIISRLQEIANRFQNVTAAQIQAWLIKATEDELTSGFAAYLEEEAKFNRGDLAIPLPPNQEVSFNQAVPNQSTEANFAELPIYE